MLDRKVLVVTGKVQGVFFRKSTQREARRIGDITGWVRNTACGSVELYAEGSSVAVEQLVQWCHKGPQKSRVTSVNVASIHLSDREVTGGFDADFDATYSRIISAAPKRGEAGTAAILERVASVGRVVDDYPDSNSRLYPLFFVAADID